MVASPNNIESVVRFPELGMRTLPLSAKTLPEDYKRLVLQADPAASEEDIVEAYLGYGTPSVPNYRCWSRMSYEDSPIPFPTSPAALPPTGTFYFFLQTPLHHGVGKSAVTRGSCTHSEPS